MRKFFALLPGAIALVFVCSCSWADTAINETNFPDANFRTYVSRSFDSNSDGTLSDEEIAEFLEFLKNNAHLIFRFAKSGGICA